MVDHSDRRNAEVRVRMRGSATPMLRQITDFCDNARAVWFGLIGLMAFSAIALPGVRDADFFVRGATTPLPLLGVSTPTETFFWASPLAVLALYIHLHASLPKLWEALAAAPAVIDGLPLRRAVHPWVLCQAGLRWRPDPAETAAPPFSTLATLGGALLGWAAAPALLGWFWLRSAAAHDTGLTVVLGVCFAVSLGLAARSWAIGRRLMRRRKPRAPWIATLTALCLALLAAAASWERAEGGLGAWLTRGAGAESGAAEASWPPRAWLGGSWLGGSWLGGSWLGGSWLGGFWLGGSWLAPPDLAGAALTRRPADWLAYDAAKRAYRDVWISRWRALSPDVGPLDRWMDYADAEFLELRAAYVDGLDGRDFGGRLQHGVDLRRADLSRAFMVGVALRRARLAEADLTGAWLEGADFSAATLSHAALVRARAERAGFEGADLSDARLDAARLERADLTDARLHRARLSQAWLKDASLLRAMADAADFSAALLDRASLAGADLSTAQGLTQEQLDSAFGDAATMLPARLRRPEHWSAALLTDETHAETWEHWRRTRAAK